MTSYVPTFHTMVFVGVFGLIYLLYIVHKTTNEQLDVYDLLMLSLVAVLPLALVFIPGLADLVARLFGIAFSFVAIFGALLFVLFVLVHRLTAKLHSVVAENRSLVQEVSLLRHELEALAHQPAHTPTRSDDA